MAEPRRVDPAPGYRLVLASASPRRRALLAEAGLVFAIDPADVDEEAIEAELGGDVEALARELARAKAVHVARRHAGADAIVLGADTTVGVPVEGREVHFGKPADATEARRMLEALSGSRHRVVTGFAALRVRDGLLQVDAEVTWVRMRRIEPAEVAAYVASGEWRGKAGGYAIQENADAFVEELAGGGFDNVVGLPVRRTLELLTRVGAAAITP